MFVRYDVNILKSYIKQKIITSLISLVVFLIILIVGIVIDNLFLGLLSIIFFVTASIFAILALTKYMKLEKEKHYQFVENCIYENLNSGRKNKALLYQVYLDDIVSLLKDFKIESYVYLNTFEEELEVDVLKEKKTLRFIFNDKGVRYTIVSFTKEPIVEKWETKNLVFNQESEILEYIVYIFNNYDW